MRPNRVTESRGTLGQNTSASGLYIYNKLENTLRNTGRTRIARFTCSSAQKILATSARMTFELVFTFRTVSRFLMQTTTRRRE